MEMLIFEKDGKTYTRFKITLKEFKLKFLRNLLTKYGIDTSGPVKKNSRYIYFERMETGLMGRCKLECPDGETECYICCTKQDSCQCRCDEMDSYEYAEECEDYETD